MSFYLHPRLAAGSHLMGRTGGCLVLLKDNAIFPWFLVVPETNLEDLHDLEPERFAEVCEVVRRVSLFVAGRFEHEKLNVASIGNQVRQMHIHIVARREDDPAWPGTVWAFDGKRPYPPEEIEAVRKAAVEMLGLDE